MVVIDTNQHMQLYCLCMFIRNDPLPTTECMPARASIETILYHTDLFLTPTVLFSYGKSFIYYMHACTQITYVVIIDTNQHMQLYVCFLYDAEFNSRCIDL